MIKKSVAVVGLVFLLSGCREYWTQLAELQKEQTTTTTTTTTTEAPPAGDTYATCAEEPGAVGNEFCNE